MKNETTELLAQVNAQMKQIEARLANGATDDEVKEDVAAVNAKIGTIEASFATIKAGLEPCANLKVNDYVIECHEIFEGTPA